jgi:hypothetical protein
MAGLAQSHSVAQSQNPNPVPWAVLCLARLRRGFLFLEDQCFENVGEGGGGYPAISLIFVGILLFVCGSSQEETF